MKLAACALIAGLAGGLCLAVSPAGASEGTGVMAAVKTAPPETTTYTDLTQLTSRVCTGAAQAFRGFFDSSLIRVHPFVIVSAMTNDSSVLGEMMADQMAAMLNDYANAVTTPSGCDQQREAGHQEVEGVMEEVDGYLRIHVLATNSRGERLSHVALVEMSAPLYRALHTYAKTWCEMRPTRSGSND